MGFVIVLILIVVVAGVWVLSRLSDLEEKSGELRARLARAEQEIMRLQAPRRAGEIQPTSAPQATGPMVLEVVKPEGLSMPPDRAGKLMVAVDLEPIPPAIPSEPSGPTPPRPPEAQPLPAQLPAPRKVLPQINWEQFMGVKLFAWIGGFALFLGITFFVKYAFENNLIPPELRVALGFLAGLGLLMGGVLLQRKDYAVTAQTLCATGVVILYSTTYACKSVYHFAFFQLAPTFLIMSLITVAAFLLAVKLEAQVVALLGMAGGFLTPVLLSTGVDNPGGLFSYIALLDLGLIAVALHRRWFFLGTLGAAGTIFMQIGWASQFFVAAKVYAAMTIFLSFDVLFLGAFFLACRRRQVNAWMTAAAMAMPAVSLFFVLYLLGFDEISQKPGSLFSFILGADLCLLALVLLEPKLHAAHLAAGTAVFLLLSVWTTGSLTAALLNWALGAYLVFAILHSVFPLVLQRFRPSPAPLWWGHLFPPLALLLVMLPMFRFTELSWFLWPCVLLIDMLAVGLALLSASVTAILAVLILTVAATAVWLVRLPSAVTEMPEVLLVIGGFAVFFFIAGLFAGRKVFGPLSEALHAGSPAGSTPDPFGLQPPELLRVQVPAFSAILPFLLLIMVVTKLAPANPSPVFGLAMLMVVLLLGMVRTFRLEMLAAVGLGCVLALEHVWHEQKFTPEAAAAPLAWYLAFYAVFSLFPFLFQRALTGRTLVWAVAALSGPAHFYLVHNLVKRAWPNECMGLLPAAFAVPSLAALVFLIRQVPAASPKRMSLLAWFGGVSLFFITLIFPIQFDRQWITLGWALEGVAVLWWFNRVPHPGLRLTGCGLLAAAFVRLALNPAVFVYQPRAATPIWNWYLYAYGLVTLCLWAGAWFLRPPRERVGPLNVSATLMSLGTALAFLLLNIEIADYFTAESSHRLTFEFSGNFARDMSYTIAWALYALALLLAGFWKQVGPARYAGLGLLSVTLLKLFFHDLSQLEKLYRIGALLGVAVIAILASFFYQRFFAAAKIQPENDPAKP